jgi:hypothetical protein
LNFKNGTVQSIRSISQRGLAVAWGRLAKGRLPSFDDFVADPRAHDPKQLAVWKVEASNGETVFRALYRGNLIDEAFNDGWIGKTLTEVTPPSLQPAIIGASHQCATTGCAIYTILKTYDGKGFAVNLQRLLLPFGNDGRVQIILASLQLVSLQGTVERRSIVGDFEARCESVLSIKIPAADFVLGPERIVNGGEFVTASTGTMTKDKSI